MFDPHPSRRGFLLGVGALAAWAATPSSALAAAGRDPRHLVVILRGALDGLGAVAPLFDRNYERARAGLLIGEDGDRAGLAIDDGYVLNPHLETLHGLYRDREAVIFHAVSSPYRGRSHFDGQDLLENGLPSKGNVRTGWLNRALAKLPTGARKAGGLGVGATVPLIMAGEAPVMTWTPASMGASSEDTRLRLLSLYETSDPGLAAALKEGLALEGLDPDAGVAGGVPPFVRSMEAIGRLFGAPDGPRIGAVDIDGWDTHAAEAPVTGRLGRKLAELDAGLAALKRSLGAAWPDTVVTLVTEFGRTVRMNGSEGTDHGTATTAFLIGGAVSGGRVIADWPGLADSDLQDGRDLRPTLDLRAIFKGTLRDHLGISEASLARDVFPDSADVKPLDDLLA